MPISIICQYNIKEFENMCREDIALGKVILFFKNCNRSKIRNLNILNEEESFD